MPALLIRRPTTRGFTLVEILMVAAIISVLAVLLFSISKRIGSGMRSTKDISNMRGMLLAIDLFSVDHRDGGRIFLAHDRYEDRYGYGFKAWFQYLRPYMGYDLDDLYTQVPAFIAPGDPSAGGRKSNLSLPAQAFLRRSYSFSTGTLDTYNRTYTWKKLQIAKPSELLFFANHRAGALGTQWIDPSSQASLNGIPTDWYSGERAHFAFLDGHVESIPVKDVLPEGVRHSIFRPVFQ